MNNRTIKIKSFTDLKVWQEGHELVVLLIKETRNLPKDEQYALANQIRRAAVSVTSNIAEGFGRQGMKEKIQFYYVAQGSLTEIKNQLLIARDVGYIKKEDFEKLLEKADQVHRLLQGLITKSKSFLNPKS